MVQRQAEEQAFRHLSVALRLHHEAQAEANRRQVRADVVEAQQREVAELIYVDLHLEEVFAAVSRLSFSFL